MFITPRHRLMMAALILALLFTITDAIAKFRPKEYDVTLITASKNCQNIDLVQGLCQGGDWAQVFTQALHLAQCVKSSTLYPRLSSRELLQCASPTWASCTVSPEHPQALVADLAAYLTTSGLASRDCLGDRSPFSQTLNPCPTQCDDATARTPTAFVDELVELSSVVTDIQDFILSYGQAVVAVRDAPSLQEYTSGLYSHQDGEQTFGVRFLLLVGWSTAGTDVSWKTVATFGPDYGQSGRILLPASSPRILAYYGVKPIL
jgi:hypothetical protein